MAKSAKAQEAFVATLDEAIQSLHWKDFETLVDVIFARSGWHRSSAIGGTQKLIDLILENPTTHERCAVQVKSSANQKRLDDFIGDADQAGTFDRLFFVCHSPRGNLAPPPDRRDIHVWSGRDFAATALRAGLSEWIIDKVT